MAADKWRGSWLRSSKNIRRTFPCTKGGDISSSSSAPTRGRGPGRYWFVRHRYLACTRGWAFRKRPPFQPYPSKASSRSRVHVLPTPSRSFVFPEDVGRTFQSCFGRCCGDNNSGCGDNKIFDGTAGDAFANGPLRTVSCCCPSNPEYNGAGCIPGDDAITFAIAA